MQRARSRQPADLATIINWIPDAAALHRFAGSRLAWPLTVEQMQNCAAADGVSAWVLEDRHEVIGHFELTPIGSRTRLGRVLLDPALRGRGLGRSLVVCAIDQARVLGAHHVDLNVVNDNFVARRLYESLGFTPTLQQGRSDVLAMTLAL